MQGDLSGGEEKAILALMAKITSITDLGTLLSVVVQELPAVVGTRGCWIYLQPDYVPQYSGLLRRGRKDLREVDLASSFDDFIVLAATNLESKKILVGKAYFGAGEGVTGWVYKHKKVLRIIDVTDDAELKALSPDLYWANEYHDGDEFYQPGDKRSILAVPLILDDDSIGTLKFHARVDKQPFSEISQEIATIVAQIISGVIRQTWMLAEQSQTISRLMETSNKDAPLDVIANITKSMKDMLTCSLTEFFIRSEGREVLQLLIRDGQKISLSDGMEFKKGQSLIGWVYKTGLPLIVSNIREFDNGITLDDEQLENYTSSNEVNDDDRYIKYEEDIRQFPESSKSLAIAFIAVPVRSKDQEVLGVLAGYRQIPARAKYPFERSQLILATSFATTISLVLENERQRNLSVLLTKLGNLNQTDLLFELVTKSIPTLVASSGCSIFTSIVRRGVTLLKLTHTSRKTWITTDGNIPDLQYELGESKTGMCGRHRLVLIANHYGNGKVSTERLNQEIRRIETDHPNDVINIIYDYSGNKVGLFQMRNDEELPPSTRASILNFARGIVVQPTGIISSKLEKYSSMEARNTWSYVAVPISSGDQLLGVITLARPTPQSPFSRSDITLLQSIAGRLSSVMNNLRVLAHREQLVMSLAHEINTPITGVLADSQNLLEEAPKNSDLQKIAEHNLGQILRLHVQASAIMSVLSEQKSNREFTKQSIFIPIKDACELFEKEAIQNGCNIVGPKARNGSFPIIEMCLFDLTIAFKNIIHNAVKYSFRPPINKDTHRTIKVWGQWDRRQREQYAIFVQNYGVGIKPLELEKRLIFEPYYRGEMASDRKRTGSGFGLAHARLVIEDIHHGFIDVTSVPQSGGAYLTTFAIRLPIFQSKR